MSAEATETNQHKKEEMAKTSDEVKDVIEEEIKNHIEPKKEEDFKAKYYYLAAEIENLRKRFEKDKEGLLKFGNEKVLSSLVAVVDNFDLTVSALKNDSDEKIQNIVKGINMIRHQFLDVLKQNGLTQIESVGAIFDPKLHEAVSLAPAPGKADQEIIEEYQRGYLLNGRLLRAPKVVIANNGNSN